MSTTRFKNTSNAEWATLQTIGTHWKFDIYGVTPKVLEGTLEQLTMVGYSGSFGFMDATLEPLQCEMEEAGDNRYGTIDSTLQPFTCEFTGTFYELLHGDMDATLEELICEMSGTFAPLLHGDIDATLQEFECLMQGKYVQNWIDTSLKKLTGVMYSGASMDAQLERVLMEGYTGMGIEASLQELTCSMDSMFGASITASLKTFTFTAQGNATFITFEPTLKKLTATFYAGSNLKCTLIKPSCTMQAFVEIKGEIEATLKALAMSSYSGSYIDAKLEPITSSGRIDTPIIGSLDLRTEHFNCSIQATTNSINSLLAILRRLTGSIQASQINPGDELALIGTLKNLQAAITGINGPVADLEGSLKQFAAELIAHMQEINNLTCSMEALTGVLRASTAEYENEDGTGELLQPDEGCSPFETLEFGVVE